MKLLSPRLWDCTIFTEGAVDRFYTDARGNVAAVSDPQFDAVIDTLRATTDPEEYQRLFREADMYTIEKHWGYMGSQFPTVSSEPAVAQRV